LVVLEGWRVVAGALHMDSRFLPFRIVIILSLVLLHFLFLLVNSNLLQILPSKPIALHEAGTRWLLHNRREQLQQPLIVFGRDTDVFIQEMFHAGAVGLRNAGHGREVGGSEVTRDFLLDVVHAGGVGIGTRHGGDGRSGALGEGRGDDGRDEVRKERWRRKGGRSCVVIKINSCPRDRLLAPAFNHPTLSPITV
jgi:hypothetical protein